MIGLFRIVAMIEGVTTLALFLFAMPAKYFFDQPQYVPPIGLAHGIAFVGYMIGMAILLRRQGLTQQEWTRTAFAAFYPFGTIFNDRMLRQKQLAAAGRLA